MSVLRAVPLGAACFVGCVVFAAGPSHAQSRPLASAAPPALRTALEAVWNHSPDLQAGAAELTAARARADAAARPLHNPALEFDVENADVNRRTVGIGLPLDLSGKRRARAAQGDAGARAAAAEFEQDRAAIAARWLQAWSGAVLSRQQLELGRRRVALMERFDALAGRRFEVGDLSGPERDLAALALGEARMQQATLVARAAGVQAALEALSGGAAAGVPDLPGRLPPAPGGSAEPPIDELPEVRAARARHAVAIAGASVARKARIPDPVLSLTGGEVRAGPVRDRVLGVTLSIPLPLLNRGDAEVAAAYADAAAAAARARALHQRAGAERAAARTRYAAQRAALVALQATSAVAFEARSALLERLWRAGELGTSDYLVQLKESLGIALATVELEADVWQAWFDYLARSGRLVDWIEGHGQEDSK